MGGCHWTIRDEQLVMSNYGHTNTADIADHLGRSAGAVRVRASKTLHLKIQKRYSCNKKYFSMPNIHSSYWAGFLAADGWIRNRNIGIMLQKRDMDRLVLFKSEINFTGPITLRWRLSREYVILNFKGKNIKRNIKDLKNNYGVVHLKANRNPEISLDKLDTNNRLAFIAGLIDGDGCIQYLLGKYLKITLVGQKKMLLWTAKTVRKLTSLVQVKHVARVKKISNVNCYRYEIGGEVARKVFRMIKSLGLNLMERKWIQHREVKYAT